MAEHEAEEFAGGNERVVHDGMGCLRFGMFRLLTRLLNTCDSKYSAVW
jgi:hypothetical protein